MEIQRILHRSCLRSVCGSLLALAQALHTQAPPLQAEDVEQVEVLGEEGSATLAQIYDYDRTIPLEPRTVELRQRDGFMREKIVFRCVQGFLVPGYLEYPEGKADP